MNAYGVKLGWTGCVNKRSVSEIVIFSAIALLHQAIFANAEVRDGAWYQVKGRQLTGATVGIIGCGHVGKDVVRLLQPFGCSVLAYDVLDFPEFYEEFGVVAVSLSELLARLDVVTLHLPLNSSTRDFLNEERLSKMKAGAVLLNLARGGLVDEVALKKMLLSEVLGGAALDVFDLEPPIFILRTLQQSGLGSSPCHQ